MLCAPAHAYWTAGPAIACDAGVILVCGGITSVRSGAMLVTSVGIGARHHQYWSAIVRTGLLFTALPFNEMWSSAMSSSVLHCATLSSSGG